MVHVAYAAFLWARQLVVIVFGGLSLKRVPTNYFWCDRDYNLWTWKKIKFSLMWTCDMIVYKMTTINLSPLISEPSTANLVLYLIAGCCHLANSIVWFQFWAEAGQNPETSVIGLCRKVQWWCHLANVRKVGGARFVVFCSPSFYTVSPKKMRLDPLILNILCSCTSLATEFSTWYPDGFSY